MNIVLMSTWRYDHKFTERNDLKILILLDNNVVEDAVDTLVHRKYMYQCTYTCTKKSALAHGTYFITCLTFSHKIRISG